MKTTPKEFFSNLGFAILTFWLIGAVIRVCFSVIDVLIDGSTYTYYLSTQAPVDAFSLASIVIVLPVLILLVRMINRDLRANPERAQIAVRRWILQCALALFSLTLLFDLILLLSRLFEGGTTLPFVLKSLVVLIVAGASWAYYFHLLRDKTIERKIDMEVMWTCVAVGLVLVVAGFVVNGTPGTRLARYNDMKRVSDLVLLEALVVDEFARSKALPASQEELVSAVGEPYAPIDPETAEPYGYEKVSDLTFKLCATFEDSLEEEDAKQFSASIASHGGGFADVATTQIIKRWGHEAGHQCFERTIDPEKLPSPTSPTSGIVPKPAI
jgi:hypothetical protein